MAETIHILEPDAPKRRHGSLARCGEFVPAAFEKLQRGKRATCDECLEKERNDSASVKALRSGSGL